MFMKNNGKRSSLILAALITALMIGSAVLVFFYAKGKLKKAAYPIAYTDEFTAVAERYGLDKSLVAALICTESRFRSDAVSGDGAVGLMQLLPDTGRWIAGKLGVSPYTDESLFDAETNLRLGTWYLDFLSDRYGGDPVLVACAYHAGHGNVDTWLTRYSRDGRTLSIGEIPMENTRSYARKVEDSYAIYLENYYQE